MTHPTRFFRLRSVSTAAWLLLFTCLAAPAVQAESRYIKPPLEVALRQARANNARLVATVQLGEQVELRQAGSDWSQIRRQDGTEGWVASRFLSTTPLLPVELVKRQEGESVDLQARMKMWSEENGRLHEEIAACTSERTTLAEKYEALAADPNSIIHAQEALAEAQGHVEELQHKLTDAQIEATVLRKNESIKWFLAGTGVLLTGWLLGRLGGGNRKKKTSLLS
ncbi:MAG: TIGR04211 family SH3 domain-containing protein [Desulfobulbus sp.]|jgi:SH3 domain protein|nr:TIGR04211 family SH3 domain-containing protein [Desulfobulbus sp.]